jgi:hypothetical protein
VSSEGPKNEKSKERKMGRRLRAAALALPFMTVMTASAAFAANTYHVYPVGYTGTMIQPGFTGLLNAYYTGTANIDGKIEYNLRVQPGDTILVHAGTYIDAPAHYGNGSPPFLGTVFDGTYYLIAQGTPTAPITIKAAGDGPVIFDGGSIPGYARNDLMFNMMAANYNIISGITVQNTNIAFLVGIKGEAAAPGVQISNVTLNNVGMGSCDVNTCRPSNGPLYGQTITGFSSSSESSRSFSHGCTYGQQVPYIGNGNGC